MISHILSLKHFLEFRYRNSLRLRWQIRSFKNQPKDHLYPDNGVSRQELLYRQKYNLDHLFDGSTAVVYKINLYFLTLLECFLSDRMTGFADKSMRVLDAGSDDWHYVSSLWAFLDYWSQRNGCSFHLKGVELDPYRMCDNLHTRLDYAEAYIRGLGNTAYEQGNVLDIAEKFELIFSFLPFVTKKEAAGWKLPLRFYDPARYFVHLYDCLQQDGLLLIVNVNQYESCIIEDILRKTQIEPVIPPQRFTSPFFSYRTARYATLIKKQR